MSVRLVGIDCAVQPNKVGVALGELKGERCRLLEARRCGANDLPADVVYAWNSAAPISLLALDAPLGWPHALAEHLEDHIAGGPLAAEPHALFRRATDTNVYQRLRKHPLDVGANFIARTAKAALDIIDELRQRTGEPIPLAWAAETPQAMAAIEVYPAATLRTHNLPLVDYKKTDQRAARQKMLDALPEWFDASAVVEASLDSADVLDSVLCVLAAVDFCDGRAIGPPSELVSVAKKEGWIWVGD